MAFVRNKFSTCGSVVFGLSHGCCCVVVQESVTTIFLCSKDMKDGNRLAHGRLLSLCVCLHWLASRH